MEKIFVINPGSTSTKVAYYEGRTEIWKESISHSREELASYGSICGELVMRLPLVKEVMAQHGVELGNLSCIAARGGPIAPLHSGAYEVNEKMCEIIRTNPQDQHASILGALIAFELAQEAGLKAYIYDAVSVDEMDPINKVTGLPFVERKGQGHNLNMRAAALKLCENEGLDYYSSSIIVAHLGGGISASLHRNGRIVDIVADEDGPFAPERAGIIPITPFIDLCCSGKYSKKELTRLFKGDGGLVAWLGTNDTRKAEELAQSDERTKLVYEAMALNVAKAIGRLAIDCRGRADRIVLTGGIANSDYFTGLITEAVDWIAPVTVIPGENEMQALADGAVRVLRGEEAARIME